MKRLIVAAVAAFAFAGCASTGSAVQEHSAAVNLVASVATMKYIEAAPAAERAARANRVRVVSGAVGELVAKESVTLADLARVAIAKIPADLAPSDRLLAVSLVQVVQQELEARYGHAGLNAESLVPLRAVLDAIDQAASFYVST